MTRRAGTLLAFVVLVSVITGGVGHAERGVGVNLGRIKIEDRLSPGGAYVLPVLGVINTGDEAGEYEVVVTHLEGQRQFPAAPDWFTLQPQRFFLDPGKVQNVSIRLTIPTGADPGDYFGYIEAHILGSQEGATIGAAAATELSFTVKPSSWLAAQRARVKRYVDDSEPWSYLIPAAFLAVLLVLLVRRSFRIRLRVERR